MCRWCEYSKSGFLDVDSFKDYFWVDVTLKNPLNVAVTLTGLTLSYESEKVSLGEQDRVEIEVIDEVYLNAKELRTVRLPLDLSMKAKLTMYKVSIEVKARCPCTISFPLLSYSFLDLLPTTESLAVRGRRLQDTALQRQTKMYAPDIIPKVDIEARKYRLAARFMDSGPYTLATGEVIGMALRIENIGAGPIGQIWLVYGPMDELWVGDAEDHPGWFL